MEPIAIAHAASVMQGDIHGTCPTEFCGVSTDSRRISHNELFFALDGENFDGHDFVRNCLERGAAAAVVKRSNRFDMDRTIHVADPLRAYQRLAGDYRMRFSIPVIAITGSHGKTTTKDIVGAILNTREDVLQTHENHNGLIGVPMTLFRLRNHHTVAVIEIGISKFGEMELLAPITAPDIAVITCAAPTHTEFLKSVENVALEKYKLFMAMKNAGVRIVNADDLALKPLWRKDCVITYGINSGDYRASLITQTTEKSLFKIHSPAQLAGEYELPLPGLHNVSNALAAICAVHSLGITSAEIQQGLNSIRLSPHRCRVLTFNQMTIIDDAYNAAPVSMCSNLKMLREIAGTERTIAVLGDMLELGDLTISEHTTVGQLVSSIPIDITFFFGELMLHAYKEAIKLGSIAFHFPSWEVAADALSTVLQHNDFVLIKASRSMHAERILEKIVKIFGRQ